MLNEYKLLNKGDRLNNIMLNVCNHISENAPDSGASYEIWSNWVINRELDYVGGVACLVTPLLTLINESDFESEEEKAEFFRDFKTVLKYAVLTPITNAKDQWSNRIDETLYQCVRNSQIFYDPSTGVVSALDHYPTAVLCPVVSTGWSWRSYSKNIKRIEPEAFFSDKIITVVTPSDLIEDEPVYYATERMLFPFSDPSDLARAIYHEKVVGYDCVYGKHGKQLFFPLSDATGIEDKAHDLVFCEDYENLLTEMDIHSKRSILYDLVSLYEEEGGIEIIYAIILVAKLQLGRTYKSKDDIAWMGDPDRVICIAPVYLLTGDDQYGQYERLVVDGVEQYAFSCGYGDRVIFPG